jgi:hypothetical protein
MQCDRGMNRTTQCPSEESRNAGRGPRDGMFGACLFANFDPGESFRHRQLPCVLQRVPQRPWPPFDVPWR